MFGIGMAAAYGGYKIDFLGGASGALLVSLATRLAVGIAWFQMFNRTGKNGLYAFVPIMGPYMAFRMVWDDFSFAALFGMTTFVAWIDAVGVTHPLITACAVFNFIMWWVFAILSSRAYGTGVILTLLYGGVPWLGSLLVALWPSAHYKGAWSTDPEAEQNLTSQERKKRRKKAAKAAAKKAK